MYALLDDIGGPPAGLGPSAGCLSEKPRKVSVSGKWYLRSKMVALVCPCELPNTYWKADPEYQLPKSVTLYMCFLVNL